MVIQRCDEGGKYEYPDPAGPPVYQQPCAAIPTYRWHSDGMAEGHWGHRCAEHARGMAAPGLILEPLPKAEMRHHLAPYDFPGDWDGWSA